MNKYCVLMTNRASQDIIDIGDYIAYTLLVPDTAKKFVAELREAISSLCEYPYRHPLVDDAVLEKQGIHYMVHKNYYIFYTIVEEKNVVLIIRVGYNRRNWKKILTSDEDR